MSRLFMLLLSLSVGTMAGIGVIVVLVMGYFELVPILIGAGVGAALAFPLTWIVAKKITETEAETEYEA